MTKRLGTLLCGLLFCSAALAECPDDAADLVSWTTQIVSLFKCNASFLFLFFFFEIKLEKKYFHRFGEVFILKDEIVFILRHSELIFLFIVFEVMTSEELNFS